jgi:NitT/TauT family transport system substrate-binding protein
MEQGFFKKHELDLDLLVAQGGGVTPPALVSNSVQIAIVTAPQLLEADEEGLDLVIVAGTVDYPLPPFPGAIARTGSGISAARDFVGHKVGVPSIGGINDVLAKNWVKTSGGDFRKVDWVETPISRMGDELKAGIVDVVIAVPPFDTQIIGSGAGYSIGNWSIAPPGAMVAAYASTRAWAQSNSGAVRDFRAALEDANRYIGDPKNADSVRAIIAKYTNLPPAAAAAIDMPVNLDAHPKPEALQFWIDVSREQGLIKGNPDPTTLFAN